MNKLLSLTLLMMFVSCSALAEGYWNNKMRCDSYDSCMEYAESKNEVMDSPYSMPTDEQWQKHYHLRTMAGIKALGFKLADIEKELKKHD